MRNKNRENIEMLLEKYYPRKFTIKEITILLEIGQQSTTLSALGACLKRGTIKEVKEDGRKKYLFKKEHFQFVDKDAFNKELSSDA